MSYIIRNAEEQDLEQILVVYQKARAFMAASGNPHQWSDGYPSRDILEADIRNGALYVLCREGRIRGAFMFRIGTDPTYRQIWEGNWHWEESYGVIHRVAGDGSGGILRACLDFCGGRADYLRIDTHGDNKVMQHLLEKYGFRRCGIIRLADGAPRIAFDRKE